MKMQMRDDAANSDISRGWPKLRCDDNCEFPLGCGTFSSLRYVWPNAAVNPERVLRAIGLNGLLGQMLI